MINTIAIDITNHCNFDCVHCLRDKLGPRAHMGPDLLEYILKQMGSVGIESACLTGGEAALHPQLDRVFALLKDHEIAFSLVSNGFLFLEKIMPLLDDAIRPCFTGACFSLDGATAQSHDRIRKEGSYERVIEAIKACVKKGIPVSVKSILHNENLGEIQEVAFLCASLGVQSLGFVILTPTPRLISEGLMPSAPAYEEAVHFIKGRMIPAFGMRIEIEGYSDPDYKPRFCNPAHGLSVDHEGNFIFCCNLSHPTAGDVPNTLGKECLGNITEIGIEEGILRHYRMLAWFMEKVMSGARGIRNCTDCFRLFGKLDWMKAYESPDH